MTFRISSRLVFYTFLKYTYIRYTIWQNFNLYLQIIAFVYGY